MDDSLSLVASDTEALSDSVTDLAFLPPSSSHSARPRMDEELVEPLVTKAVSEPGLEWSPPEEPSCSTLVPILSRSPQSAH